MSHITYLYVRSGGVQIWRRWQSTATISVQQRTAVPPLRVLFCGSDAFSAYSLFSLHKLPASIIKSIDVVCKTPIRKSRGKTIIVPPLIQEAAERIDLPVHSITTFKGWTPPRPFDLIVAVSFGLLIPPRILSLAIHGGINVHPSFLPDLHGPAPIHWAMIRGDTHSGVTLQTLHPTKFDQGKIIDQSPRPGVELTYSNDKVAATADNIDRLGLAGADMLSRSLETGAFLNHMDRTESSMTTSAVQPMHARKIAKEDMRLNWTETADQILRKSVVMPILWDTVTRERLKKVESEGLDSPEKVGKAMRDAKGTRTNFTDWRDLSDLVRGIKEGGHDIVELEDVAADTRGEQVETQTDKTAQMDSADDKRPVLPRSGHGLPRRNPFLLQTESQGWLLVFRTCDGRYIGPGRAQLAGKTFGPIANYISAAVTRVVANRRQSKESRPGMREGIPPHPASVSEEASSTGTI